MILDAAREVLATRGHENFSLRKLAESIGYSPGTIYLYFRDKHDVLHALVEESFDKLLSELETSLVSSDDLVTRVKTGLRTYIHFGLKNPNHYRFAFLVTPPPESDRDGNPRRGHQPHPAYYMLKQDVDASIKSGAFRQMDVECATQALWCAAHGVTSLLIVRPEFPWVEKEKLINRVIDSAVNSLLPLVPRSGSISAKE